MEWYQLQLQLQLLVPTNSSLLNVMLSETLFVTMNVEHKVVPSLLSFHNDTTNLSVICTHLYYIYFMTWISFSLSFFVLGQVFYQHTTVFTESFLALHDFRPIIIFLLICLWSWPNAYLLLLGKQYILIKNEKLWLWVIQAMEIIVI